MPVLANAQWEAFARAVASGKKYSEAAKDAGYEGKFVSSSATRLSKNVKIRQRIDELSGKIADQVVTSVAEAQTLAITESKNRVASINETHRRLWMMSDDRAADPKFQQISGGRTGFVAQKVKTIRRTAADGTQSTTVITEYSADYDLVKAIMDCSKLAAQELGQWHPKESPEENKEVKKIEYVWTEPKLLESGEAQAEAKSVEMSAEAEIIDTVVH